ncbi:MOSC domain-containing protein [Pelagovum pacificum]|uniref:MOSC domain-containing protein n=1 Tax=Pelagovum pacificum TaxID=2588711 RepID=A0A5C5GCT2_9RHOB|nr:MOSC domain-containing protein [Pelagovum pacificum]QQA41400.1 MOSC domain-containing protein [Pelagovum pacificum]TNY31797.1 MOSC domain-containing protein [Pelagovum pacificum]
MSLLADLRARHASEGRVTWIGLRPVRLAAMETPNTVEVTLSGLDGDHARAGKRAVTLIQQEHLSVIAALSGRDEVNPEEVRRNLVIAGINLAALRDVPVRYGTALLRISGPCPPCSRMERVLGPGGYNAMRGHGGWYAEVLEPGRIAIGDSVQPDFKNTEISDN